jgi:hypothetical protein
MAIIRSNCGHVPPGHHGIPNGIIKRIYRRLNRVDMMTAGQDLRGMVQSGLVEQTGFGRWTRYRLFISDVGVKVTAIESKEEKIISFIKRHGSITNADCRELL